MTTRTIIAESMQQAMKQAKKELGDGAIILHSERFGQHIEVTVTDDMSCLQRHAEERALAKKAKAEAKKLEDARIEAGITAKEQRALKELREQAQLPSALLSEQQKELLLQQAVNKTSHEESDTAPKNEAPVTNAALVGNKPNFSDALEKAKDDSIAQSQSKQNNSSVDDVTDKESASGSEPEKKGDGFDWNKFSSVLINTSAKRRQVKAKTIPKNADGSKKNALSKNKKKADKAKEKEKAKSQMSKAAAKLKKASTEGSIPLEHTKKAPEVTPIKDQTQSDTATPLAVEAQCNEPALKRVIGDLKSLGDYWDSFGIYWDRYAEAYQYPWSKELRERLNYLHLSDELRERLIRQYREIPEVPDAWRLILSELSRTLEISRYDVIKNGGAYAFVGPAGAGKTTTIGKIAAEYVLRHGAEKVGLISTDIFRIASYEQLLTIGRILDVDVEVVDAQQGGLAKALNNFSDKSLVLVDTAGLRRNDRDLAQQLVEIKRQGERMQTMLVLPGNLQYESMQSCYESYQGTDFKGCIFTKLDECTTLGSAVSLAVTTKTPVAYLASGHTIPDDLVRATGPLLIEQLLTFACQERDISLLERSSVADALCLDDDQQMQLI